MSVFFNGRLVVSPATISAVDDSAMVNTNANVGNVLAVIGSSTGGQPFTPLSFGSASQARKVLRSGEMLTAIEKAFDASADVAGPATVIAVRVNPAVQASVTLVDVLAAPSVIIQAADYGAYTSQIKVKVETGTSAGKKVTVQLGNDYYVGDNLARDAFQVAYLGAAISAKIDVRGATVVLIEANVVVATISLTDFPTVQALSDRIAAQTGWTSAVLNASGDRPSAFALDTQLAAAVSATPVVISMNLDEVVRWLNSTASPLTTATRGGGDALPPANVGYTFLTGGTDGVTINSSWQQGFDALQLADVQWVCPVSSNPAIHAMTQSHVDFMSNVARKERRAVVGSALGTSDTAAIALALAINDDRVSLVHLGCYDYDIDGTGALTLYPPYITAAFVAGAFSGANPGVALTNKSLKIRGVERELRNPTDTDALILGGVLAIEKTSKGFKVVKSISTWLNNDNYNRVEVSTGAAVDYMMRAVREVVDELRGQGNSPATLASAVSRTHSVLTRLSIPAPNGVGLLVGDAASPPFKNITASSDGDVIAIEWQASPVIPVNYITCVSHIVPYSGTASA